MRPLRLLHVVPTYLPAWRHGGPIVSVHGLCRSLAERGHRLTVFTTDVHGPGRLDVPLGTPVDRDGVETFYFPVATPRRLYRSPAMARALRRAFPPRVEDSAGSPGFDLVHLHSVFLWPTSAAARAARRAGVPYLLAPRGMLVPELVAERGRLRKRAWLRLVERRTIEQAAALHATTELEARDAGRFGFHLPPVRVVPNGVDLGPFRDPSQEGAAPESTVRADLRKLATGPPFVLALGRLSWKKGLDRLIRALPLVGGSPAGETLVLALAGPDDEGYGPRLEALAVELGVRDRLLLLGPVHGPDKLFLLRKALALALPSRSENFANAVLEAMAATTPVVVSPEVGLADEVARSGAGVVVPGEPKALAGALAALAADPEEAREMGCLGREAAEAYAWPRVAERMEEVYREVLARSKGGNG